MDKNKLTALEKFALLPNITIFEEGEFTKVDKEQDEGYTPTLYWYDRAYCVDWMSEENDTILGLMVILLKKLLIKLLIFV